MALDVDPFFSKLNPVLARLLRTPVLHHLASRNLVLLTVTGRKTGRRYSMPVGYQLDPGAPGDGGTLDVLVSKARRKQWWRNYLDERPIELCLRGRNRSGRAVVVPPASPEFRAIAEAQLRRLPSLGRVFGVDFDPQQGLDAEQLAHLREEIAAVRIALEAEPPSR